MTPNLMPEKEAGTSIEPTATNLAGNCCPRLNEIKRNIEVCEREKESRRESSAKRVFKLFIFCLFKFKSKVYTDREMSFVTYYS